MAINTRCNYCLYQIIWVGHSQGDVCAYGAKHWLSTSVRQHERLTYIMARNNPSPKGQHITIFPVLNS